MGNFAGSAVSPCCARSLTTSPSKRARCSKRVCRRKRPSTATSCRRNSRISLCFPGDLPSARRSRSFTRSGGEEKKSNQGRKEKNKLLLHTNTKNEGKKTSPNKTTATP